MPHIPRLSEPLTDERVALRDGAERDIPEILIAYQDDPELHLQMGEERPPSGAELGRSAENEPSDRAAGRRAALTILEPGSEVCAGQVYIHHLSLEHARAELGMWLAPQHRGRGLGAGALRLAVRWLLVDCGLARLQVLTDPGNGAMLGTARAAGFVYEGILHGYLRTARGRSDAAILSLLPSDLVGRCATGE